jgi:hypothetical protein
MCSADDLGNAADNNLSFVGALHAHSERTIHGAPLYFKLSRDNLFPQATSFYKLLPASSCLGHSGYDLKEKTALTLEELEGNSLTSFFSW